MKIGLQLYSVRDDMARDMEKTLRAVKEMGYDYVEFAGYFDKTPEQIRDLLDKIGLKCRSVHQGYNVYLEDFDKYVSLLKTIGATSTCIPWMGEDSHLGGENCEDAFKAISELGYKLAQVGITQHYHNHEFEYKTHNGKVKLDYLYEKIPADALETELDVCWITYGGANPYDEIVKYADRTTILHLKDFIAKRINAGPAYALIDDNGAADATREDNGLKFVCLGDGQVDFEAVFKAAEKAGVDMLIVEQDEPAEGMTALECARRSREFLRKHGY